MRASVPSPLPHTAIPPQGKPITELLQSSSGLPEHVVAQAFPQRLEPSLCPYQNGTKTEDLKTTTKTALGELERIQHGTHGTIPGGQQSPGPCLLPPARCLA